MKIAVIITSYNRKEKTRKCLFSLSQIVTEHTFDVYLTEDGSTDGTIEMIQKDYPTVHLIHGDGNLFWNRGMYAAWKEAMKAEYDYYLWLNDDVVLYPYFLEELFDCMRMMGGDAIVSGLIEDQDKSKIIYGGSDSQKRIATPSDRPTIVTFMNGNVVLIPKVIVDAIGILDPVYHHDLGDVDYGLRAIEAGYKVVTTCKPVAYGYENNFCRVRKWNSSLLGRFKKLYSPLGSNPSINFYFKKRHYGFFNAVCYWAFLHFINILPDKLILMMFGDRYIG